VALRRELEIIDVLPSRQSDTLVEAGVPRPIARAVAQMFEDAPQFWRHVGDAELQSANLQQCEGFLQLTSTGLTPSGYSSRNLLEVRHLLRLVAGRLGRFSQLSAHV
jgi:hypothetical protein